LTKQIKKVYNQTVMAEAVVLSKTQYSNLIGRLDRLEGIILRLTTKLEKILTSPKYGSSNWWSRSIAQSEQDYQSGNFLIFDSAEKTQHYLDSLK